MYKNNRIEELIKVNTIFINTEVYKKPDRKTMKDIVEVLNTDKKVIVSGIDFVGKTDTIRTILKKTNNLKHSIYFNKRLDLENIIKTGNNLKKYINKSIKNNTKIIVLQNIGEIENIKGFLKDLFKTNYKIIIIGNDIKVSFIQDIEVKQSIGKDIEKELRYGNIGLLGNSTDAESLKIGISLIKDKIILDNIFDLKSVKDIDLYTSTISFLSKLDSFFSVREIHTDFTKSESIAIKTFSDYIEYTEQSKIIQKINLYDIKRKKDISTKNRYFFLDNGLLNSLNHFRQKKSLLVKNLIFIKLYYYNFDIFGGRFGTYEFDFYVKVDTKISFALHLTNETNLKKDIARLKKVDATKKYLIVEDLEKLSIRKKTYDALEILSLEDFLKKDLD